MLKDINYTNEKWKNKQLEKYRKNKIAQREYTGYTYITLRMKLSGLRPRPWPELRGDSPLDTTLIQTQLQEEPVKVPELWRLHNTYTTAAVVVQSVLHLSSADSLWCFHHMYIASPVVTSASPLLFWRRTGEYPPVGFFHVTRAIRKSRK